jgi:putative thioredoxin
MIDSHVIDVSTATFERDVLEASFEQPVVVDFWAPWCGPCRQISPVLERLAAEAGGAWRLAKINVDENQQLAVEFGVQGIPAVKGFRDGRIVAEFVGAQPEMSIRRFLDRLVPSEADLHAGEGRRLAEAGALAGAEAAYRRALSAQADHAGTLLGLGSLLLDAGRPDEARPLLEGLLPNTPEGRQAAPLLARLRLAGGEQSPDLDEARRTLASDPRDPVANLALGQALAAQGDYAAALPHLLAVVERDKSFRDGAARQAMLSIFDVLGPEHPLTAEYRRKLASALYI